VKSEDKKLILLARFLYSNSDIYIIEDYLTEHSTLLNYSLIEEVLFRHLKGKTVIYNSNILDYIKMSTLTLKFKSTSSFSVRKTAAFLDRVKANPSEKFQRLASVKPKHLIGRTFKNSLFIQTAGFEEELIIHKKLEKQKKEIEQLAKEEKNILVRLFHGIVLTTRRLQEGRNFSETSLKGEKASFKVFWRFLYCNYRALLFATLAACLLSELSFALAEYLILISFSSSDGLISDQLIQTKSIFVVCFTSFCLLSFFGFHALLSRLCLKASDKLYFDTLNLLMNCDPSYVQQNYIHTILNRVSSDTHVLERNILRDMLSITQGLCCSLVSMYAIVHVFSFVIPLCVLGLLLAAKAFTISQLYPSYQKLAGLASHYEQKTQVLSNQLLAIIPSLRRNKLMQVIDKRFFSLNTNCLAVTRCIRATHRAIIDKVEWVLLFLASGLLLGMAAYVSGSSSANWLGVGKPSVAWGLVHIYRLLAKSGGVYWKLARLDERLSVYARIFGLNSDLVKRQKVSNKISWSKVEFNQLRPIVFKNVSLTLGYQPVLKKVSFVIVPNSRVGIFGIDGFGRKAIFEILIGFKKPDPGKSKASIFGVEVEDLTAELLGHIFMIEKDPNLLEGTIYQNIDPYSKMRHEQVADILNKFRVDICCKNQRANILEIRRSKTSKKQTSLPIDLSLRLAEETQKEPSQSPHKANPPGPKVPSGQSGTPLKLNLQFTTDINQKRNSYLQIKTHQLSSDEVMSPIKVELQKHKMKHPQHFSSRLIQEDKEVEEAINSIQLKNRTSLEKSHAVKSLMSNAEGDRSRGLPENAGSRTRTRSARPPREGTSSPARPTGASSSRWPTSTCPTR
jgi:ABC-type multidrug transport system fused ATPase/permease subunit